MVFSLLELPPSQLDFLRRLGQYIDIYIFHFNPSQEYWADSVDPDWKARYDFAAGRALSFSVLKKPVNVNRMMRKSKHFFRL